MFQVHSKEFSGPQGLYMICCNADGCCKVVHFICSFGMIHENIKDIFKMTTTVL
jgi:hypothetical protein